MGVMHVLHMNGGLGETSYANNSWLQREVISMAIPIVKEAITDLYLRISPLPSNFLIADLGCSSGSNTFFLISKLIDMIEQLQKEMGQQVPHEYQVFLNDLPGNDFNALFRALPRSQACFFNGVPGSFYDRLFPRKSLHFVHSSYSLHWLSQAPESLEVNKGNICITSTSPRSVVEAYSGQFQNDFSIFLQHRAQELVPGGCIVLTMFGRTSDDPSNAECCCLWELLGMALNEMVSEGLIEEEKLDAFNIPLYKPSPAEVKAEVLKEGSFSINHLKLSEVNWSGNQQEKEYSHQSSNDGYRAEAYSVARSVRAALEPMLVSHFGQGVIEDVFRRHRLLIEDRMGKEETKFINVTVSLTRKPI